MPFFKDRTDAGCQLGANLKPLVRDRKTLVLCLVPGGVAVGAAIADELGLPYELLLVEPLTLNGDGHGATGAVTPEHSVMAEDMARADGADAGASREAADRKRRVLRERWAALGAPEWSLEEVTGKSIILADDGLGKALAVQAAIEVIRAFDAGEIIVALPTAQPADSDLIGDCADDVICVITPQRKVPPDRWYADRQSLSDKDVRKFLTDHGGNRK